MKTAIAAVLLLSLSALPAFAGSAPVKSKQSPESVAASCEALGTTGAALTGGCV